MIDVDEKLWLEYTKQVSEHNIAQVDNEIKENEAVYNEFDRERTDFNALPWYKKIFREYPKTKGLWPKKSMNVFLIQPSIEGYLTWKAKGKKL